MGGRAAIYLRVSKGERHTDNQRPDVERMVLRSNASWRWNAFRAIEWAKRAPFGVSVQDGEAAVVEIRPLFDAADFDPGKGV